MRAAMAVCSAALVAFSALDWHAMPMGARGLVLLLAPAMAFLAITAPAWRQRPWFVAGPAGIAFPNDTLLVQTAGTPAAHDWLLVPWSNVEAVRVSRLGGSDAGACVAMRVRVTEADRARYFERIASAVDAIDDPQWLELAWAEALPRPAEVVAAVEALRGQVPPASGPAGDAPTARAQTRARHDASRATGTRA